jgi:hypothetical protein
MHGCWPAGEPLQFPPLSSIPSESTTLGLHAKCGRTGIQGALIDHDAPAKFRILSSLSFRVRSVLLTWHFVNSERSRGGTPPALRHRWAKERTKYSVQDAAAETPWTTHPVNFDVPFAARPSPAIARSAMPCSFNGDNTSLDASTQSPSTTQLIEFATSLAYAFIVALFVSYFIGVYWPPDA